MMQHTACRLTLACNSTCTTSYCAAPGAMPWVPTTMTWPRHPCFCACMHILTCTESMTRWLHDTLSATHLYQQRARASRCIGKTATKSWQVYWGTCRIRQTSTKVQARCQTWVGPRKFLICRPSMRCCTRLKCAPANFLRWMRSNGCVALTRLCIIQVLAGARSNTWCRRTQLANAPPPPKMRSQACILTFFLYENKPQ